ncbi:HlyC/CorC family transporter [Bordetella holmesii]|uniref:Transporter associated domain protein n=2 Tax=Bordetella holmesii TaxID=35814 RepID=A0A158M4J2_9BORD|nr:transporter associated domain-containing protein [Bordetella holmesii]AHV93171.1 transporter associated domain protein [Bordetella holmesii ATCC 51541]AIT27634.1 transporter associated domain protein [Bordetella holmesii 44057]EWM40409.1 transporter associated domain protein [Bordetella holmesii 35009]EWM41580.1 transporter associated domain protein [Bordetella holmesii 41130]EWM49212.1 transporter associated domain protein [Bordetella holmesii 70147]
MSDPYPAADSSASPHKPSKSLLDRVMSLVRREPEDREGIKAFVDAAHDRALIDAESYTMIKGALAVSERTVADIMVPRSRMDLLDVSLPVPQLLAAIIETAHSRFPVYEDDRDNILGVLLAKDLLRYMQDPSIELRSLIRPAIFIPEAKRLNVLLREFRSARNHIAIVIDEHGGISGLVTMEDVLEQIVGDIEDEFDEDEEESIFPEGDNQWRMLAATDISYFNETFSTQMPDDEYDSVGGWLGGKLGRIPRRGDTAEFAGLQFEVIRADPRRALWLRVRRAPQSLRPETNA